MKRALVVLLIALWPGAMVAQQPADWSAVGRLDFGERGFCTATLIAPSLVITAAHCLMDPTAGAPMAEADIQFLAGWRTGQAVAERAIQRVILHPEYRPDADEADIRTRYDLALLTLAQPIPDIVPLGVATSPSPGGLVAVVSYSAAQSEMPQVQPGCRVLGWDAGVITTSCVAEFGASGAPVITIIDGQAHVVSLVAAKAISGELRVSLGPVLQGNVQALLAANRRASLLELRQRMTP